MRFVENPFRESGRFARALDGRARISPRPPRLCADASGRLPGARRYSRRSFAACEGRIASLRIEFLQSAGRVLRHASDRQPRIIVSAATAGNHGRAVAWSARRMARRCCPAKIFVPSLTSPARIEAIRKEGAEVRVVDGSYEDAVRLCDRESREHGWQVISDVGYEGYMEIPKWVVEGYETLFLEIEEQPDARCGFHSGRRRRVALGRGRTFSAVLKSSRSSLNPPTVFSNRSPPASLQFRKGAQNSIMAGLNCSEVSLTAWPSIRRGVDMFVAIED